MRLPLARTRHLLIAMLASCAIACGATATPAPTRTPLPSTAPPAATPTQAPTPTPVGTQGATATPRPTPERTVVLTAELASEVSNEERTASGSATIVFELQRDSERITAATAQFTFSLKGLPANARVQFSHIHVGKVDGPIVLDSGLTAARFRFTDGAGSISLPAMQCDPALATQILADPGGYFFRVHSARNPDGVVRGQLKRA